MKKLISLLLTVAMITALAGCGQKENTGDASSKLPSKEVIASSDTVTSAEQSSKTETSAEQSADTMTSTAQSSNTVTSDKPSSNTVTTSSEQPVSSRDVTSIDISSSDSSTVTSTIPYDYDTPCGEGQRSIHYTRDSVPKATVGGTDNIWLNHTPNHLDCVEVEYEVEDKTIAKIVETSKRSVTFEGLKVGTTKIWVHVKSNEGNFSEDFTIYVSEDGGCK